MDHLTSAGRVLASEIARSGPIPFSRFMEVALYHPDFGYYRRERDPFGREGDFYTAEQVQPVFGRLVAAIIRALATEFDDPREVEIVEMGAGRREMAGAFAGFRYTPVDVGYGVLPERFTGIVFSNEFFDAVPVDLLTRKDSRIVERRVDFAEDCFSWDDSRRSAAAMPAEVDVYEVQTHRTEWLTRIASRLERGYILTIDYGYTRRELIRFPQGTLMGYRRHRAMEDVLARPGEQDITAHVDFSALQDHAAGLNLSNVRFESLGSALLRAGEPDEFAAALGAEEEREAQKLRLQLKTLLFGMGETFRVLLQRK